MQLAMLCIPAEDALAIADARRKKAPKQAMLLELLCDFGSLAVTDLLTFSASGRESLQKLCSDQLVVIYQQEIYRKPEGIVSERKPLPVLNSEQQTILENMIAAEDSRKPALLLGVTGSGKTSIYAHLIDNTLKRGKSAILLVPEIALTPQILESFSSWFGETVALQHSGLSSGVRYDEWKRIRRGDARLIIGTRSAVFAPAQNLGLIIQDEEQEDSYRSETTPRYSAGEISRYRCLQENAFFVMGSATPDLRSRFAAEKGIYSLYSLPNRYNRKPLPEVKIIDMKQELRSGNTGIFSRELRESLLMRIERKEQSILFLNRRGTSKLVTCSRCGYIYRCPHCSVSMTWHANLHRLICHYCGSNRFLDQSCPDCGGELSFVGAGTQKVEEELHRFFPDTAVLRVDADSVAPAGSHGLLFRRFAEEKIPIMIGTQMVAKGLNFENVTLVGVLSADQSLYCNDYRAGERSFDLLTQVIGRCGRADLPGQALIQTYTPENEIIRLAAKQDYDSFYRSELELRRIQGAPPFRDHISFSASGREEKKLIDALNICRVQLSTVLSGAESLEILGPVPFPVVKVSDRFRYRLYISCVIDKSVRQAIAAVLSRCGCDTAMRGLQFYIEPEPSL